VSLVRGVKHGLGEPCRVVAHGVTGCDDRGEGRGGSPAGEQSASSLRHSQPFAKPVQHRQLERRGTGGHDPGSAEEVVSGRDPVSQDCGECRAALDVGYEARVRLSGVVGDHVPLELGQQRLEVGAAPWSRTRDHSVGLSAAQRASGRLLPECGEMASHQVGDPAPEALHGGVVEVEQGDVGDVGCLDVGMYSVHGRFSIRKAMPAINLPRQRLTSSHPNIPTSKHPSIP
jgi:hypothetical protein